MDAAEETEKYPDSSSMFMKSDASMEVNHVFRKEAADRYIYIYSGS